MSDNAPIGRRTYLKGVGAGGLLTMTGLAGCTGGDSGSSGTNGSSNGSTNASGGGGETIQIGSDIPYRPFEFRDVDGNLTGFDPAIADAVFGDQLGMTPNFNDTSFDGIIQSLNNGNFRVVMSAMTINDERDQQVDFSDPYFTAYQTILVLEDSQIRSQSDLRGRTVGVQSGTTGETAANELQEQFNGELTIRQYDQIPAAFDALSNNQVEAVIADNTVNVDYANQQQGVRLVQGEGEASAQGENAPEYLTLTVEQYGIAFRENDGDLIAQVNDALATIREDGTYDEIYNEYFSG